MTTNKKRWPQIQTFIQDLPPPEDAGKVVDELVAPINPDSPPEAIEAKKAEIGAVGRQRGVRARRMALRTKHRLLSALDQVKALVAITVKELDEVRAELARTPVASRVRGALFQLGALALYVVGYCLCLAVLPPAMGIRAGTWQAIFIGLVPALAMLALEPIFERVLEGPFRKRHELDPGRRRLARLSMAVFAFMLMALAVATSAFEAGLREEYAKLMVALGARTTAVGLSPALVGYAVLSIGLLATLAGPFLAVVGLHELRDGGVRARGKRRSRQLQQELSAHVLAGEDLRRESELEVAEASLVEQQAEAEVEAFIQRGLAALAARLVRPLAAPVQAPINVPATPPPAPTAPSRPTSDNDLFQHLLQVRRQALAQRHRLPASITDGATP